MADDLKQVVIIGKSGVGKSTIGNYILGSRALKVGTSASNVKQKGLSEARDLEVVVVNTLPPSDERDTSSNCCERCTRLWRRRRIVDSGEATTSEFAATPAQYYQTYLQPDRVSLVIFVYKQGRFTDETKVEFEEVIQSLNEGIRKKIVLVITYCEGMNLESKLQLIDDFKTNRQTKKIASYVSNIVCVGFPDLSEVQQELHKIYTEEIKTSEAILQSLVSLYTDGQKPISNEHRCTCTIT